MKTKSVTKSFAQLPPEINRIDGVKSELVSAPDNKATGGGKMKKQQSKKGDTGPAEKGTSATGMCNT